MQHMRSFTLAELAQMTQSTLVGDGSMRITNVADLESAGAEDASFLANPNYDKAMRASKAGVVFVSPKDKLEPGRNFLISDNPSRAFQKTVDAFFGDMILTGFKEVHPTAVIHETAALGEGVVVGPRAVIDANCKVGKGTSIGAGVYVGPSTIIGERCLIHPNATIRERCEIGSRVIIQPGAIIGSCGFGFTTDAQGHHEKLNQVGTVVIEDDVEIGANTTIDRSRFKATMIGRGTKIDNLVQIGHGVIVGPYNIIVAQTGIAGSTKTGSYVAIGGQVAIAGHIAITDRVMIAAKSGVSKSITESGKYNGIPALPVQEYNRITVHLRRIESLVEQVKALQKQIEQLRDERSQMA